MYMLRYWVQSVTSVIYSKQARIGQLSLGGKLFLLLWGPKDRLLLLCDYVILLCEFYNLDFFFRGGVGDPLDQRMVS